MSKTDVVVIFVNTKYVIYGWYQYTDYNTDNNTQYTS